MYHLFDKIRTVRKETPIVISSEDLTSNPEKIMPLFCGKVGIDVAVEALKTYWKKGKVDLNLLRNLAKESRVLRIMTPYIETVIHDQS